MRSAADRIVLVGGANTEIQFCTCAYLVYLSSWTENEDLRRWIQRNVAQLEPSAVHLCTGSESERKWLLEDMVSTGTLIRLNPKLRPNSFLARSDVTDVARVEENTYICR